VRAFMQGITMFLTLALTTAALALRPTHRSAFAPPNIAQRRARPPFAQPDYRSYSSDGYTKYNEDGFWTWNGAEWISSDQLGISPISGGSAPQQADIGGAQVVWELVPYYGAYPVSNRGGLDQIRNGQEQILGRYDMVQQDPYVSRAQCVVNVGADGTATLTSVGKPPTMVRAYDGDPWTNIRKGETHVLSDGEQINVVCIMSAHSIRPSTIYTIRCYADGTGTGTDTSSDDIQYSEDGYWMWNGAEWVPAGQ